MVTASDKTVGRIRNQLDEKRLETDYVRLKKNRTVRDEIFCLLKKNCRNLTDR